jgi:Asp-tRNA(Asn)/Glu-tRNA(Gln) amidotransferase A subunit family amidase
MVPFAYGTQSTGSIARPASYCGVVGYKPTFGVISSAGLKPISPSQDTVGVLTRSVADAALVALDLADLPARANEAAMPRLALCRSSQWRHADREMRRQIEAVAASLQALGFARDDVTLDDSLEQAILDQEEIFAFEAFAALAYERATARDRMSGALRERLARGGKIDLTRYLTMQRRTAAARHRVAALFEDADVLLYPAADGEAEAGLSFSGSPRFGALWTLLHLPSIVIPFGYGPGGLPWGLQLIGRYGDDERLLIAAEKLTASGRTS